MNGFKYSVPIAALAVVVLGLASHSLASSAHRPDLDQAATATGVPPGGAIPNVVAPAPNVPVTATEPPGRRPILHGVASQPQIHARPIIVTPTPVKGPGIISGPAAAGVPPPPGNVTPSVPRVTPSPAPH